MVNLKNGFGDTIDDAFNTPNGVSSGFKDPFQNGMIKFNYFKYINQYSILLIFYRSIQ